MPNCPVYARIDGRAFHTFCRGLEKPFSHAFIETMEEVCKYLVEETGAVLGYVQSDEISLGWENYSKAPFEGRIQKLESVLASMASAKFVHRIEENKSGGLHINDGVTKLWNRANLYLPTFDCRIFNVPDMTELANAFLWRENDAIKNSITGMALNFFSNNQIQNKSGEDKIAMMKEKGYDFYKDTPEAFLRGTFFHRETYLKELTEEELSKIPQNQRCNLVHDTETDLKGNAIKDRWCCWRSRIVPMVLPWRLSDTKDVSGVLFNGVQPLCNKDNPTFFLTGAKKEVKE
jgi:tRNA(His) 5'-end guanylyltransferase